MSWERKYESVREREREDDDDDVPDAVKGSSFRKAVLRDQQDQGDGAPPLPRLLLLLLLSTVTIGDLRLSAFSASFSPSPLFASLIHLIPR